MKKYLRRFHMNLSQSKEVYLKMFVAIGAAVLIGVAFGSVVLLMIQQNPHPTTVITAPNTADNKDKETANTTYSLQLVMYGIQIGVFQEEDNAIIHQKQSKSDAIIWEKMDKYYVFTDFYLEEVTAKDAVKVEKTDAFVKKIEINKEVKTLSSKDEQWLKAFMALWQESLQTLNSKEQYGKEKWDTLFENTSENSKQIKQFSDKIKGIFHNGEMSDRIILYHSIIAYDELKL